MALSIAQMLHLVQREVDRTLNREFILEAITKTTGIRDGALAHTVLAQAREGKPRPLFEILVDAGYITKNGDGYEHTF
jgi:hypothetical protein